MLGSCCYAAVQNVLKGPRFSFQAWNYLKRDNPLYSTNNAIKYLEDIILSALSAESLPCDVVCLCFGMRLLCVWCRQKRKGGPIRSVLATICPLFSKLMCEYICERGKHSGTLLIVSINRSKKRNYLSLLCVQPLITLTVRRISSHTDAFISAGFCGNTVCFSSESKAIAAWKFQMGKCRRLTSYLQYFWIGQVATNGSQNGFLVFSRLMLQWMSII